MHFTPVAMHNANNGTCIALFKNHTETIKQDLTSFSKSKFQPIHEILVNKNSYN